jgi:capsular polysaccharide biosynthesis protein
MEEELAAYNRRTPKSPAKEINLKELFSVIKRRLWIVILFTLICAILGGLYSTRPEVPIYSASSRIIVNSESAEMLGTLKVFIKEPIVLKQVIDELKLPSSTGILRNQISVSSIDGSLITLITAVNSDPEMAVKIVNALVNVYSRQLPTVFPTSGIKVLTEAEPSAHPSPINPPSNRAFIVSIFIGIAMGIGAVFLIDSLDDSIRSKRDVESQLEMVLLGQVCPFTKKDVSSKSKRNKYEQRRGASIGS